MAIPDGVEMVPVTSSNVSAVGYDPVMLRLFVRFNSGDEYAYDGVEPETHRFFLAADSKGKFLNRVIRAGGSDSRYAYRKLN